METETLTYDFGTTPEEVIREALTETFMDETADEEPIMWRKALSSNDLLTVLDALALSATTVRYRTDRKDGSPMFNCDGEGNRLPDYMQAACGQDEARRLRISILAALGIKEG